MIFMLIIIIILLYIRRRLFNLPTPFGCFLPFFFFFFFFFFCVLGEPHVQEHSSNISSVLLIFGYFLPSISIYIYILNELEFTCFSVVDRLFFFYCYFCVKANSIKACMFGNHPYECVLYSCCALEV